MEKMIVTTVQMPGNSVKFHGRLVAFLRRFYANRERLYSRLRAWSISLRAVCGAKLIYFGFRSCIGYFTTRGGFEILSYPNNQAPAPGSDDWLIGIDEANQHKVRYA